MNAIIDNKISIFEQEIGVIERLLEIGRLSGNAANKMMSLYLQAKAIEKEAESFNVYISRIERDVIIDQDGCLNDRLSDILQALKAEYQAYRPLHDELPLAAFVHRFIAKQTLRAMQAAFEHLERARIDIIEHDCDAGGISGQGPFDNIDDLMKALNS
jgi:hypothetical protein